MLPTQKQLELRLLMTADPTVAHRAMELLAADAQKVDEAAKKAKRSLGEAMSQRERDVHSGAYVQRQMEAKRLAGLERAADLQQKYGIFGGTVGAGQSVLGGAGAAAGWLAAGAAVAATAANMTHAFGQLDNEFLTTREKALGFARTLPIIGEAFAHLVDNAMDAIDRLEDPETASRVDRDAIGLPIELAQGEARFAARQRGQGLYREVRDAQQRLEALQNYRNLDFQDRLAMRNPDPITGAAAAIAITGYREVQDPRAKAAEDAVQLARRAFAEASYGATSAYSDKEHALREWNSAKAALQATRSRTLKEEAAAKDPGLDRRDAAYQKARENVRQHFGDGTKSALVGRWFGASAYLFPTYTGTAPEPPGSAAGTKNSYMDAINQERRAEQQAQQALALLQEKLSASKEKQLNLLQKEYELNKAITASKKVQLSLLDEEYARARGGAQAFGALDQSAQSDFLGAALRFKSGGRENVTAEELGQLSANPITAGLVQDRLFRDTKGDPQLQQLFQLAGLRDAETVGAAQTKLKADVVLNVQADEERFAKLVAEKLKELNLRELFEGFVKEQLELQLRRPKLESDRARLERGN